MSQLRNPYANGDEVDGHEHDDRFHGPHGANRMKTDPDDAVRSTNNDAVMARISAAQLGYIDDPFVNYFSPIKSVRKPPLINRGTHLRFKAVDRLVRNFCTAFNNHCQIISLGAGSDTRYFLLKRDSINVAGYFEIDFPAITSQKVSILKRKRELFGLASSDISWVREECHADNYHLIASDLRQWQSECVEKLHQSGLDNSLPTLVLSECVLIYMDPQHADRIIQWAADTFHTGGFLTYEQIRPNDAFGKMMMQNLQTRNIELKGILAFPDLEAQQARYKDRGWSHVTAVDMQSVYDKSISDAEAIRIGKIELLDELEEWRMLNQHYCLVSARNNSSDPRSPFRQVFI